MILSKLEPEELQAEAMRRDYAKWWSLCLLRLLGLPTLNAAFIQSPCSALDLKQGIQEFLNTIGLDAALVRSDGGSETSAYVRGGITYSRDEGLEQRVAELVDHGRAVILLEPTNRFSNQLCLNITIDRRGGWIAEGLGCGFDTSDLQRGLVPPQWAWRGNTSEFDGASNRARFVELRVPDVSYEDRVEQRLDSIITLMPNVFRDKEAVRHFLVESRNSCLFEESSKPSTRQILNTVRDASKIYDFMGGEIAPFTLAYSILWDRRPIYWDVTPGLLKWQF